MADDVKKSEEKPGYVFDFKGFKQGEKRLVNKSLAGKADDEEMYPIISKAIVAWPFPGDPKDVTLYDEMDALDFQEVGAQFVLALKKYFGQG